MERRGALPPIILILTLIATLVITGIVAYYLIYVHKAAASRPLLIVPSSRVYVSGGTAYFVLRNDGPVGYSGTVCVIFPGKDPECVSTTVPAGGSVRVEIPNVDTSGLPAEFEAVVQTSEGDLEVTVKVLGG